jgi:hypothetical protein
MDLKLKKEEEEHIKLLLSTKPKPQHEETKKWIDQQVRILLKKYKTGNKLF